MVAYRFCRPDDIPELVAAVNRCYDVHFDGAPLTVEGFRREMREVQLWPSNSMLARAGEEAVAVVLGTKRTREVLVRRIGVAPGHQRQGHGRHLLDSLSHKLAVLGPPRLVAEVPAGLADARAFFAGAGWREEAELRDFRREALPDEGRAGSTAAEARDVTLPSRQIGLAELEEAGLLPADAGLAWERQPESLRAAGGLVGVALGDQSVEAWALFRPSGGGAELLRCGFPGGDVERLLPPLAAAVQRALPGPLRLPRFSADELPAPLLVALGFLPGTAFIRFATVAEAA